MVQFPGTSFIYDATLFSMMIGGISATLICFLAMVGSTRKLFKLEPRELYSLEPKSGAQAPQVLLFGGKGIAGQVYYAYYFRFCLCIQLASPAV